MLKQILLIILISCEIRANTFRLPNDTRPEAYHVVLTFGDIQSSIVFDGEVFIKIHIEEDTREITIHSAVGVVDQPFLCINMTTICPNPIPLTYFYVSDREFLILKSPNPLIKDQIFYLNLRYNASIYNAVNGVYRGNYLSQLGVRNFFLATHMQPTFARRVFPCYDEPKFKAKFYLTLIHDDQYSSITNMDLEQEIRSPSEVVRVFKPTPLLPTYLIAFVVSKFESLISIYNDTTFRTFARDGQVKNTKFGLDTAIKALRNFEKTFELNYQEMTKLDQVALPTFNFGGMENHGIVFYREDFLLYDEQEDTAYDKEYVAQTVAHEVCHKWLGNLMTPKWWSVLWLSEGFCKLYEYYMVKPIYPDMRTDEMFVVETLQVVMIRDASPNVRPMTFYVETPSAIRGIFDSIAYSKSASVLRMFMHAFTPDNFHKGLNIYLTNTTGNPEGIAEPGNLYSALQEALPNEVEVNVKSVMESWETQAGFPYLYVERGYNGNQVRFTQSRFLNNGQEDNSLWHIPITFSTSIDDFTKVEQFWTNARTMEIRIDNIRPNDQLIVNVNQVGYFRVLYDNANWMSIANFLCSDYYKLLSPTTRAMLIDDAAIFVESDMLDMRIFLEVLKYLENDADWIPWYTATENIWYMRRMLDDGSSLIYRDFREFLRKILTKVYMTYESEEKSNEPHHHKHIRNIAINWACQAHLDECLSDTQRLFNEGKINGFDTLSNDHRSAIMCNGVLMTNRATYESLLEYYNYSSSSYRVLVLQSIGCIENEEILTDFIGKYNEVDHWLTLIQAVYANGPIGLRVTQKFLKEKFEEFNQFIINGIRQSNLNSIMTGIANRVNTQKLYDDHIELMELYRIPESTRTTAISTMTTNLAWINKHSSTIQAFLDNSSSKLIAVWPVIICAVMLKFLV